MTANISWNMQNASTGIASGPGQATAAVPVSGLAATANPASWPAVFSSPTNSKPPRRPAPLMSLAKAKLKP